MMGIPEFAVIDISAISDDISFAYRYPSQPPKALKESIAQSGILHPLVVYQAGTEIILVHGFRRRAIGRELGIKTVPVWIYTQPVSQAELFRLGILENSADSSLNMIERVTVLQIAANKNLDNNLNWPAFLNLPGKSQQLRSLYRIIMLADPWKLWIAEKNIPVRRLLNILRLHDLELLLPVVRSQPSVSNVEKLCEMLNEIILRDESALADILVNAKMEPDAEILTDQEFRQLMQNISRQRYPVLTELQQNMNSRIKALDAPNSVQIKYDTTFENTGLDVNIHLVNKNDISETTDFFLKNGDVLSRLAEGMSGDKK